MSDFDYKAACEALIETSMIVSKRIADLEQALREARSMLDWCASSHKPNDGDILTVIGDIDEALGEGK